LDDLFINICSYKKNEVINVYFYLGAPGVEMEFVSCDNTILREVVESSIVLNGIILDMECQKY